MIDILGDQAAIYRIEKQGNQWVGKLDHSFENPTMNGFRVLGKRSSMKENSLFYERMGFTPDARHSIERTRKEFVSGQEAFIDPNSGYQSVRTDEDVEIAQSIKCEGQYILVF